MEKKTEWRDDRFRVNGKRLEGNWHCMGCLEHQSKTIQTPTFSTMQLEEIRCSGAGEKMKSYVL